MLENLSIINQGDTSYPASLEKSPGPRGGAFSIVFVADSNGKAAAAVEGCSGWLVDMKIYPALDVAPSASWDLYVTDQWGNIIYSRTDLAASGNPADALQLWQVAPARINFVCAGMGSGGKARVTFTVADEL